MLQSGHAANCVFLVIYFSMMSRLRACEDVLPSVDRLVTHLAELLQAGNSEVGSVLRLRVANAVALCLRCRCSRFCLRCAACSKLHASSELDSGPRVRLLRPLAGTRQEHKISPHRLSRHRRRRYNYA